MPGQQYIVPPTIDQSQIVNLLPEHTNRAPLLPTTPVVCVNRGPRTLEDKYDGDDYVIPARTLFQVTFAAAQHFQRRQIVPGTRNPDPNSPGVQYVSWIGIVGIDPPEACEVFTDEELELFGESAEGLNRALLPTAVDRNAQVHSTKALGRQLPGMGLVPSAQAMSGGGAGHPLQEIVGGSEENREALGLMDPVDPDLKRPHMRKVEGSDAKVDEAQGAGAGFQKPSEASLRVASDETPRQRDLAPPAPPIGRQRHRARPEG